MVASSKEGQTTAILAVREFQRARLTAKLGNDWTEARIGMFFSGLDAHEDNEAPADELLTVADASDYLTIGLKDSNSYYLPGEAGGYFIGVRSTGTTTKVLAPAGSAAGWFADSSQQCSAVGYAGTTLINGGVLSNGSLQFPDPEPSSGYSGFYCLKFVVAGRDLSSQSVSVSVARSSQVAGFDYGKAALYQAINSASFGVAGSVAWNTGASARALPDAAWVRIPFYNARIRIQEIMAVKISP
jgi:hypothetical protein